MAQREGFQEPPQWASTPIVDSSTGEGLGRRTTVAARLAESEDMTPTGPTLPMAAAWSPTYALGQPPNTTTPTYISDPQVWQCMEKLSFIVGEMSKRDDKVPVWKPSAAMTPAQARPEMSPTEFRVWARSVADYGKACKWPKEQGALSVRLLCDEHTQKAIDARYKKREWERLSVEEAIQCRKNRHHRTEV